jgi:hypothetical protein
MIAGAAFQHGTGCTGKFIQEETALQKWHKTEKR